MTGKMKGKNLFKEDFNIPKTRKVNTPKRRYRIKSEIVFDEQLKTYKVISAPLHFSLLQNTEETIVFIRKLERLYLDKERVFVDLEKITYLDYSAVTVLVSVMFSFKARNIKFNGNFPKDFALKKMLVDSEFFKYLKKPVNEKLEYTIGKENQIFTRANKEVNSELGLVVMIEATQTIWNSKRVCKGLQRTLLELMQNTNNHASTKGKGEMHWWLSVNHDKANKKVSFVFVDYGVGIFESLKHKPKENKWYGWADKLKDKVLHGGNYEVLKLLLEGEMHLTVTGQHFRGKGLPGIKEVMDRGQISNLVIISNNVFADVSNKKYLKLRKQFSGTFVTWELNEMNKNIEWTIS
jgi:hypothetical protein